MGFYRIIAYLFICFNYCVSCVWNGISIYLSRVYYAEGKKLRTRIFPKILENWKRNGRKESELKEKKKKRNKGNIFGEKTHRYKCSWNFREVWRWRECGPSSFPFEVYAANVSWQFHSLQTLIRHRECEARSYFCKKKLGFSFNPFQLFQFQF